MQAFIQLFVCRSASARAHVRSWAPCNDGMLQPVLAEGCWAIRLPAGSELLLCLLTFCTALLCAGGTSLWSLLNCKIHLLLKVIITNAVETNLADSACRQHCPAGLCWLLFPCCFSPWLCKSTKPTPVAVAFPAQLFYFSPLSLCSGAGNPSRLSNHTVKGCMMRGRCSNLKSGPPVQSACPYEGGRQSSQIRTLWLWNKIRI